MVAVASSIPPYIKVKIIRQLVLGRWLFKATKIWGPEENHVLDIGAKKSFIQLVLIIKIIKYAQLAMNRNSSWDNMTWKFSRVSYYLCSKIQAWGALI